MGQENQTPNQDIPETLGDKTAEAVIHQSQWACVGLSKEIQLENAELLDNCPAPESMEIRNSETIKISHDFDFNTLRPGDYEITVIADEEDVRNLFNITFESEDVGIEDFVDTIKKRIPGATFEIQKGIRGEPGSFRRDSLHINELDIGGEVNMGLGASLVKIPRTLSTNGRRTRNAVTFGLIVSRPF